MTHAKPTRRKIVQAGAAGAALLAAGRDAFSGDQLADHVGASKPITTADPDD